MRAEHPFTADEIGGGKPPTLTPWEALSETLLVPQPAEACLERLLDRLVDRE